MSTTTVSPGASLSRSRNGRLIVVRCPATTMLPRSPGPAVPGQWLGPRLMAVRVMPSPSGWSTPSLGMRIRPSVTAGVAA